MDRINGTNTIRRFKYDYNNKMFIINISLGVIFLFLSIVTFKEIAAFVLFFVASLLGFFNAIFLIFPQGIRITKKNNLIILDQLGFRKIRVDDIRYVSFKEIHKEKKSIFFGFFAEFFLPYTYISHCMYVYNQGKVYNIYFHLIDGTTQVSYFGWLYREKLSKVQKTEKKLDCFIKGINSICISQRQMNYNK